MWGRRTVRPILIRTVQGWDLREEAPRRVWTAVIGPTAVASYLRLREAATRRASIALPPNLDTLLREGVVAAHSGRLLVPDRVPALGIERLRGSAAGRRVITG